MRIRRELNKTGLAESQSATSGVRTVNRFPRIPSIALVNARLRTLCPAAPAALNTRTGRNPRKRGLRPVFWNNTSPIYEDGWY
ncbi:hypothetical protein SAMN05216191_1259 [Paenibacillus jilunlii]|uniref:Uncharacterized protein n=1 Tax=Paenibacillus jilunlii TaxID=682956 RepID=A0A1G9Y4Z5_9BACL|nr:hypothetical protein SAMN05216191_1259 [Paenibacillus jilunlii]